MGKEITAGLFPEEGFIYIVCGQRKYYDEALVSVRSLKKNNPHAHVTLVSDRNYDDMSDFDNIVIDSLEKGESETTWIKGLLYKTKHIYLSSPYKKTLFVDSDTYFLDDCSCLFQILDHYDISLAHGTNDRNIVSVSGKSIEPLTPYNTGVILFNKGADTRDFFQEWHACYEKKLNELPHDQPAFVEALSNSKCKTYVLQNNWNARFIFPEKYAGRIVILHGRHQDFEFIGERINVTETARLWFPEIENCIWDTMDRKAIFELLRFCFKKMFNKS